MNEFSERNSNIRPYSLINRSKLQRNVDKSIIAELPQSIDLGQRLKQKDLEIERLTHALQFYRNNNNKAGNNDQNSEKKSINPFDFYLNSDKKVPSQTNLVKLQEFLFDTQIKQLIEQSSKAYSLKLQNQELKQEIHILQTQIMELKQIKGSRGSISQKEINAKMKSSQSQTNKLKSQIWSLQAEINKINYENTQLKKAINSIARIKMGQESESIVRVIQQSSEFNHQSISSYAQGKLSQLKQQLESKSSEVESLRQKNIELQARLFKMGEELASHQDNELNPKNNIESPKKPPKSKNNGRHSLSSQKRVSILNSITQMEMMDVERYQLKIAEKNREYEQLYSRYQKVESEKMNLEEVNEELERQRKFLADRLSEIEVLQEGDEVVGEMQNKLVLMSTQLMRLGNLNRHKMREAQDLSVQLKELIHKYELLQKQTIEKDKILLNYKQQLTLIQQRIQEKSLLDEYDQQTLQEYKKELLEKDKEITRLSFLNKEQEEDGKTYELKLRVLEEKVHRLEQENRDLEREVKDVEKSVMNQSSVKYFNMELEVEKFKNLAADLEQEAKTYQNKLTVARTQISSLDQARSTLQQQKITLQQQRSSFNTQLKKLQFSLQQKDHQIRDLKHSYQQKLIIKNEQIRELSQKVSIMTKNAQSLMRSSKIPVENNLQSHHKMQQENMILKIEISKYEERLAKMQAQAQALNRTLNKLSTQNQALNKATVTIGQKDKQLRDLRRTLQSSNNKIKRLEEEKQLYEHRAKQSVEQIKRLEKYETQYIKIKNQYETTKYQLEIKEQQYLSLYRKFQAGQLGSLSPRNNNLSESQLKSQNRVLQSKISTMVEQHQSQLRSLTNQLQAYKQRISEFQLQQDQDSVHEQLSQQIIRLNTVLSAQTQQIIASAKEIQLYQHKLQKCEQLLSQQRNSKLRDLVGSYISSNSLLQVDKQRTSRNQQKEIILLNERNKQLKQTNRAIQEKLDFLMTEKIRLQHRVSQLEYSKGQRSMIYHEKQSHLGNIITEIRSSNERLQQSIKQIQQHYIEKLQERQERYYKLQRQYETHKNSTQLQLQRMSSQISRLQEQKLRLQQEQDRQQKNLSQIRSQQNLQSYQEHIKIKQQYQVKVVLLSQELERCQMLKDEKSEQLQRVREKLEKAEDERKEMIIERESNRNTVEILSQEIQRLSVVLSNNIEDIKELERQNVKYSNKLEQLSKENTQLKANSSDNPNANTKLIPLKQYQSLSFTHSQVLSQLSTIQHQLTLCNQQLEQLTHRLQSQRKHSLQLQQENNRLIRQKRLIGQQKDNLETKFRQVKRNEQHLKELLNEEMKKKQTSEIQLIEKRSLLQEYQYRERQEKLKENNVSRQLEDHRQLQLNYQDLQRKYQEISKKYQQTQRIYLQLQRKCQQLQRKNTQQSEELISKQKQLQMSYRQQQTHSFNTLSQQIQSLRQSNSSLQAKFQLILQQNQKLVYQVEGFKRAKSNSASSNKNDSQEQVNALKTQNQILRKQLSQLQQRILENNKFRGQVQAYQQQQTQYQSRIKRIISQKNNLFQELSKLQQQHKEKCNEVRKMNTKVNELQDQLHSARGRLQKVNNELATLKRQYKLLGQQLQSYQRSSSLQSQQQNSSKIKAEYYTKTIKMTSIDEVDEKEERSRGPSAHQNLSKDFIQKYELLESINAKLKKENECYRKKSIEYEFKMNKLKEQFDLLSKLINEYRDENDKLKKAISSQAVRGQYARNNSLDHNTSKLISNQTLPTQHYSQTRIPNNTFTISPNRSQSPFQINAQMQKSLQSPTNLTMTKNGSSITFRGSSMNMNEYNELKESMHHIQNQISSQTNIQGMAQSMTQAMVTLPISQIHMLINEIERLFGENKSLAQQLNDSKVMLIKFQSGKSRNQQNLATMVLMIVEIQALRHRVAVAEAQKQQLRRQSFSPSKNHR